jgi:regulator of RNase E activity RraB
VGLLDRLGRGARRFWSEEAFRQQAANQVGMVPETLGQLAQLGVTGDDRLKLEYFFYTDSPEKASALVVDLDSLGYEVEHGPSAADKRQSIVTGWTAAMTMSTDIVQSWVRQMCDLGFKHDCQFDGWGTTPEQ